MFLSPIWWVCLEEWAGWPHTPFSSQEHQTVHGLECDEPRKSPGFRGRTGRVLYWNPSQLGRSEGKVGTNK